jgi:hypothetical protein
VLRAWKNISAVRATVRRWAAGTPFSAELAGGREVHHALRPNVIPFAAHRNQANGETLSPHHSANVVQAQGKLFAKCFFFDAKKSVTQVSWKRRGIRSRRDHPRGVSSSTVRLALTTPRGAGDLRS